MLITTKNKGFTLIELLIVVAIIAILAAIAIPNFLAAQVRSKVSRSKSEIRTLSTANIAYYVDNNEYPPSSGWYGIDGGVNGADIVYDKLGVGEAYFLKGIPFLTSPVSYLSSMPNDVFNGPPNRHYAYYAVPRNNNIDPDGGGVPWFKLYSVGPDGYWDRAYTPYDFSINYDPSNGTVSNGDIQRLGGETGWSKDENRD